MNTFVNNSTGKYKIPNSRVGYWQRFDSGNTHTQLHIQDSIYVVPACQRPLCALDDYICFIDRM